MRNSIFSGRRPECPLYVGVASTPIADHNLFHLPPNETLLTHGAMTCTCANIAPRGEGNACGDPLSVRPAWGEVGDYHLQAGSPAVDAGTSNGAPTADPEHRSRDARPEIGAYE